MSQDARHTLRLWANRPWPTGFAIAALAIGIGATTGVFSVVNALLLRSLPFRDPSGLVSLPSLRTPLPPHDSSRQFHDWRRQSSYLSDVALYEQADVNLGVVRGAMRAHVAQVSWNFFSMLGVRPVLGRAFGAEEDIPGRNQLAVIGYGLWQQLFAGDRKAFGATIRVDGLPLTIVGVAPAEFDFPRGAVLWKTAAFSPGNNGWETVARLKPGVTWQQARLAFNAELDRLSPNLNPPATLTSLRDELAGSVKNASLMLMAGVVMILLIACTNVANLLLARTADRAAEFSIRSALGASRARLARQLLTECLLLSTVAGIAGLIIAFWSTALAARVHPVPLEAQSYSILDGRVLGFAMLASLVCALLFGVLPALYAGRGDGARNWSSNRYSRANRDTFVAVQVALTIVLLTASVSLGRAFVRMTRVDRGFDAKGVVTVSVSLEGTTYQDGKRRLAYFEQALARIRQLPGVRSASATDFLPLYATGFVGGPLGLDGRPAKLNPMWVPVLSDYFRTLGGRILYGREFTDAEVRSGANVAVVSERFAEEFGDPAEALGRQLTQEDAPPRKIVGIVKTTDYMVEGANATQVFFPADSPGGFFSTFLARVNGRAEDHLAAVRDAIRLLDAEVPVFGTKTMEQRMADALALPKFYSTTVEFFAAFALLLALIGIYGVVSYAVTQRTRELAIRMALGTTPVRLRGVLLRQGLTTVAAGAITGIAGALFAGRFLENLIEGGNSIDLATFASSALFIVLIASISIWRATRRIAGLDVMALLRTE